MRFAVGDAVEVLFVVRHENGSLVDEWRPATVVISDEYKIGIALANGQRRVLHAQTRMVRHAETISRGMDSGARPFGR
jgi:hypothetical protein